MFQRLSNLVRGFFSLFISGLERQNPEALLEVEQENLRKQIGQYNQGLATHAGLCERLISQVRQLENEQRDLRARTTANLRAGNRDAAGQLALRLQTVDRELTENRAQLEQAREDLQGPGQSSRCRHQCRATEDRVAEGRHQRHEDEEGDGRADRDGFRNDHQHRRLGRDARSAQYDRRRGAHQGGRPRSRRARQHGHVWRGRERGRAESTGRSGAG